MIQATRGPADRWDEGFTLIELLVVVLILGILMAIAIPTFLNLTSGAKTNAAEADLTTAAQDEGTYLTQWGDFDGTSGTTYAADNIATASVPVGMNTLDPSLHWLTGTPSATTAGTKTIYVAALTGTNASALLLGTAGQNGKFYWIYDNSGALSYDITTIATPITAPPVSPFWGASWVLATSATS